VSRLAVALVALGSALVGAVTAGALVLAVADGGRTTTIVTEAALPATGVPAATAVPVLGNRFDPAALYASRSPGVVTVYADLGPDGGSQGSGFVVDRTGLILTNAHVITNVAEDPETVEGATRVYVEFKDRERVPAEIVGWDLFADTGVLRVDPAAHPLRPVPLGSSAGVRVGQPVAAIGSPFGKQSSLSVGVVSAIGRTIDSIATRFAISDAIQIDAPINRGNSGGPLFDARGRAIGINTQIQSTSGTAEGVGFAVPIDRALRSLRQLVATGKARYAYVGITTQDLTPGVARALGLAVERGALVANVDAGTPAERAGLRSSTGTRRVNGVDVATGGDVIVSLAGEPVRSSDDIGRIVSERLSPGETVVFAVVRDGARLDIRVTLVDRPAGR
jgi:S1-C subfamily serine protease